MSDTPVSSPDPVPSPNDVRFVVFDCDGTLVDSLHIIHESMDVAFQEAGLGALPPDSVRPLVGLSLLDVVARLAPDPEDEALVALIAENYRNAHRVLSADASRAARLFDGVTETLQALERQGYIMGIATGKGRRGLEHVLDDHDLARYFTVLKTADCGPGKPNPAILKDAMAEVGAAPAATVMIGDTTFDMVMAKQAGAGAIGVAWGYHEPESLRSAGAAMVAETFPGLDDLLTALWNET